MAVGTAVASAGAGIRKQQQGFRDVINRAKEQHAAAQEGGGSVPVHGEESHTGGAGPVGKRDKVWGGTAGAVEGKPLIVGGGEQPEEWSAMNRKDFATMGRGARKEYMKGLTMDQRKEQMDSMMPKGPFGGIFGRLGSALFYKMPAAGKYKNSPIEKNYGSPAQRGFKTPLELKTFGIGSLEGGTTGKPRAKTGPGGKFND